MHRHNIMNVSSTAVNSVLLLPHILWGAEVIHIFPGVCLCEQDCAKCARAIFMKPCEINNYCCETNWLNFGIDPIQNGWIAVICNFFIMVAPSGEFGENKFLFHSYSPDDACILHIIHICLVEVCYLQAASSLSYVLSVNTLNFGLLIYWLDMSVYMWLSSSNKMNLYNNCVLNSKMQTIKCCDGAAENGYMS